MKKIVNVEDEGLISLLGEKVTIFTSGYFYTGILEGVNETCVKLKDPSIVYDTGSFDTKEWQDCQSLCVPFWYVKLAAIESFGILK